MPETILTTQQGSVGILTLNRPEAHNAMSNHMVEEIISYFEGIRTDRSVRAVIIRAEGKTFCAGGDIKDLQDSASMSMDEKIAVMSRFDLMLQTVNTAPQVTVAQVQGGAFGGGFGLVCVSDIAIASTNAKFGLPEVRMGISPALISPYVIDRVGLTIARRLMLTGARFDAETARNYGILHEVCEPDELSAQVAKAVNEVLQCSPNALAETKALIHHVTARTLEQSLPYRAELISQIRDSEEGQEGMLAFIQKRQANWVEEFSDD